MAVRQALAMTIFFISSLLKILLFGWTIE
jgi:hypothetical protein